MPSNIYETDRSLSEYLLFHYGELAEVLPFNFGPREAVGFPARCVNDCLEMTLLPADARAIDLGCAVGRSAFELARFCADVTGIDSSQHFIRAAAQLKKMGRLGFDRLDEGSLTSRCVAEVPRGIERSRVHFEVGDAQRLRPTIGTFNVVLAANVLCRLEQPLKLLQSFPRLVRSGGQLIITTPCTWTKEFTPSAQWLGGYERSGHRVSTFETLQEVLTRDFTLLRARDMPFLLREHARKYQWSVAHSSTWVRK